jgi:hypothetical protein
MRSVKENRAEKAVEKANEKAAEKRNKMYGVGSNAATGLMTGATL